MDRKMEATHEHSRHVQTVFSILCCSAHTEHLGCPSRTEFKWTHHVWQFSETQNKYKISVLRKLAA